MSARTTFHHAEPLPVRDPIAKLEQRMRIMGKSDTSIERYRATCEEFRRAIGVKVAYTTDDVEAFQAFQLNKPKVRGHLDEPEMKGSYLRYVHYCLKALFKANKWPWYEEEEDLLPKLNRPLRKWYSFEDIEKILDAAKKGGNLRDYLGFRLIVLAFSRRRSWRLLQRWDYDPDHGTLKMPSIKGGRNINIELDKETNDLMLKWLASRTDAYPALLPSFRPRNDKGMMRPEYINTLLKKYCDLAGVECKGVHAFRRGMVTYMHEVLGYSETEIWQMGDWTTKDMVSEYIQLGADYATKGRKEGHPFFEQQRRSKRAPLEEGPEETPRERRLRLSRPNARDLSEP
jgi:integrase